MHREIKAKHYSLLLTIIFFISLVIYSLVKGFEVRRCIKSNQASIDGAIKNLSLMQDGIQHDLDLLLPIMDNRHLSDTQLGQLYLLISNIYYYSNDMENYFKTIGYAIYYSERVGALDDLIYIYATIARYFKEIGNDSRAYEIITMARDKRSFYDCHNVLTRIQALEVYFYYLLDRGEYEECFKALAQIEEDSKEARNYNKDFQEMYTRSSHALTALVYLKQGMLDKAHEISSSLYNQYLREPSYLTQFQTYDFFLPVLYVECIYYLEHNDYTKALKLSEEYIKFCDMFFFEYNKISLTKEIFLKLSDGPMKKNMLINISRSMDHAYNTYVKNYSYLCNDKFNSVMSDLSLKQNKKDEIIRKSRILCINILVCLCILTVILWIYSESMTDGLTSLNNRRCLNYLLSKYKLHNKKYGAIMIDIDDFKKCNDVYGHAFGDEVLRWFSHVIKQYESRNIKAYRYGGEEIVIITNRLHKNKIIRLAEAIRTDLSCHKWDKDVQVTCSLGIGFDADSPIQEADENMYYSKTNGKNFTIYTEGSEKVIAERRLKIRK